MNLKQMQDLAPWDWPPDARATILGRRILDGEPEVRILKQWVPVKCRVARIGGFSAHADWKEVLHWLEGMESGVPQRTFLTHGEPEAAQAMGAHIKERFGWNVHVPQDGERVELV
jgi:metallo-beta-lactamase family protein